MTFSYKAYGLIFDSELVLPELTEFSRDSTNSSFPETVDVSIRVGQVPEALENASVSGVLYQASADNFLLNLHDIASYLVCNGNQIVVQPKAGALDSDIRVFMLGSVFGALLHQRQLLVIHAGAIHTQAGAALFAGPSGIGKSTLLGELLNRGYPMLVDDVCAVTLDDDQLPVVLPGYPRTRIWADSASKLSVATAALPRTRPQLEKFERQMPEQFWNKPDPLYRIYLLSSINEDVLSLTRQPAIDRFTTVLQNTYRNTFLEGLDMRQPHFNLVSAVASTTTVVQVVRPTATFKLTELADMIEQDLKIA